MLKVRYARVPVELLESARWDKDFAYKLTTGEAEADQPYEAVDIGHSFDGLWYLLAPVRKEIFGMALSEPPDDLMTKAIFGALSLGKEPDFSDGDQIEPPIRFSDPRVVKAIADILQSVTGEVLAESYDPEEMDKCQVFPAEWEDDEEEGLKYLMEMFPVFKNLYLAAAEEGQGVIVSMSL